MAWRLRCLWFFCCFFRGNVDGAKVLLAPLVMWALAYVRLHIKKCLVPHIIVAGRWTNTKYLLAVLGGTRTGSCNRVRLVLLVIGSRLFLASAFTCFNWGALFWGMLTVKVFLALLVSGLHNKKTLYHTPSWWGDEQITTSGRKHNPRMPKKMGFLDYM